MANLTDFNTHAESTSRGRNGHLLKKSEFFKHERMAGDGEAMGRLESYNVIRCTNSVNLQLPQIYRWGHPAEGLSEGRAKDLPISAFQDPVKYAHMWDHRFIFRNESICFDLIFPAASQTSNGQTTGV